MSETNKEYLKSEDLLESLPEDPLLSCLITLARFYHKPATALAFTAGLPLVNNRLTPELFVRAASRIDLAARISKKPLLKINTMLLPTVLILKNNQACILTEINQSSAKIIQPETGGTTTTNIASLQELYTGYAILVQPAYEFSSRSQEVTSKVPKNWFWGSIYHTLPIYGEVLLAALLINLFAIALPLFAMNVYDRVVPNAAVETLWVLAIGVVLVFCFDFLMRSLRGYFIDVAGKSIDLRLSAAVFEQVLGIKMASRPGSVGAFVNTVQGFEIFRDFITSSTVTVLVDIPFTFIFLAIIAVLGGTLAIIPLVVIPIVILVGYILQLPMARLTQESYRHAAEKQATLIESLSGIEAIKSEGAEGPVQRRFERVVQMASLISLKLKMYSNTSINFAIFIQQLTNVVVVIFGVYKIAQGNLTVGGLIAVTLLTGRALAPMSQVAALIARYHQAMNALLSLDKVMKMPVERPHGKTMLHRANFSGQIQFRDVSFLYPGQAIESLYHVSFIIKPGEHVAIIGRVGSGKSTVAKLILGLYQPTNGSILVDDTELNQIDPAELRHHVGYVPQDVVLFYGSVKDNIVLGAPYVDDATILRSAQIAGVDRFVNENPEGYDLQVGERASRLSGGQRQAIAIARSVLLNPPILVMDEPTNDMDDATETQLKINLDTYIKNKTFVLVTHKSSMLGLVNRLIVMDAGQVVADGPKDEILRLLREGKIKTPPRHQGAPSPQQGAAGQAPQRQAPPQQSNEAQKSQRPGQL